jgi:hypothetical protein
VGTSRERSIFKVVTMFRIGLFISDGVAKQHLRCAVTLHGAIILLPVIHLVALYLACLAMPISRAALHLTLTRLLVTS